MIRYKDIKLLLAEVADFPFIISLFREDNVGKTLIQEPDVLADDQIIPFLLLGNAKLFVIVQEKADEAKLTGFITLKNIDHRNQKAELGNIAAIPGVNLGANAMQALVGYAFEDLNLNKVIFKTWGDNFKVMGWYSRKKIFLEGVERQHIYRGGKFVDLHRFSILKSEFGMIFKGD